MTQLPTELYRPAATAVGTETPDRHYEKKSESQAKAVNVEKYSNIHCLLIVSK